MTTTELMDRLEHMMANAIVLGDLAVFHLSSEERAAVLKETGDHFNAIVDAIENNQITFVDSNN